MESNDGITRWANLCMIPTAKSRQWYGLSMDIDERNEQKTAPATRVSKLAKASRLGVALPLTHASRMTLQFARLPVHNTASSPRIALVNSINMDAIYGVCQCVAQLSWGHGASPNPVS
jgi:hypothetical protein